MNENINIPITIKSDKKGYLDRQCPNEECLYNFKINMEDWENKVSDDEVHCPMCGHIDTSDKWRTEQQLESEEDILTSYVMSYISDEFEKMFKELEESTKNNKYFNIKYRPGKKISFINNPIGQSSEWEIEIKCEKCGTRYSVIGSAYFCPCCGYNSVENVLSESLDAIRKMKDSIPEIKNTLAKSYGKDKAETMGRMMLEGLIGDIVSTFQKYAEMKFKDISSDKVRVNDFQVVQKGSNLFKKATGKGYDKWLSEKEINTMNLYFQRRHLIEHHKGLVDLKYIEKSGDTSYSVNQRIVVKEKDIVLLLEIIEKLTNGLKLI
ncbi:hypothetical protein [Terrisporobacter sp.]